MSRYLTFPLIILRGFHVDIGACLNDAMNYCLYERSLKKDVEQVEWIGLAIKEIEAVKYRSPKTSFDQGRMLYESIPDNSPKTSITKDIIFDFYKNSKTEFELITFMAFAAIRSILQRQGYCKITNEYLIGRMACNSSKGLPIPDSLMKYNNRY